MCKHIFANVIFCIILLNVQSITIKGRTSVLTSVEKTKSFPENAVIKIEPAKESISLCQGDDCQELEDFDSKKGRQEQREKATRSLNFLKGKLQEEKMKNEEFRKKEDANKKQMQNQLQEHLDKIEELIANAKDKIKGTTTSESEKTTKDESTSEEIPSEPIQSDEKVDDVVIAPLEEEKETQNELTIEPESEEVKDDIDEDVNTESPVEESKSSEEETLSEASSLPEEEKKEQTPITPNEQPEIISEPEKVESEDKKIQDVASTQPEIIEPEKVNTESQAPKEEQPLSSTQQPIEENKEDTSSS